MILAQEPVTLCYRLPELAGLDRPTGFTRVGTDEPLGNLTSSAKLELAGGDSALKGNLVIHAHILGDVISLVVYELEHLRHLFIGQRRLGTVLVLT